MTISIGDKLPDVQFMYMSDAGPAPLSTSEVFDGKLVALFAVPGAFTPTCSNQHFPSYVENNEALREKGVDAIICLSVNDAFVLNAWAKQQNADGKVMMLADGNGDFTQATGLVMDGTGLGMGKRSLRYSMVVRDGVVEQLNVEDNPGVATVSSAMTMLEQL